MTRLTLSRAGMLSAAAALITVCSPMLPVQAQYVYGDDVQQALRRDNKLTPEQREDMFRARKSWRKNTYKRRESILETERRCVNDARTMDAFEACRKETKNSKRALRAEFRDYINPLRRRVGLPPLEEKRNMRRMDNDQGRRA